MATINHHYTCRYIDSGIKSFKTDIYNSLDNLLEECCPLLEHTGQRERFLNGWTEEIFKNLEDIFESVRKENSDLRSAAENQIENLEKEIEKLLNND